ncbi:MAG: type I restriction endonuclease [Xenococcaceae cyanobacterium]
MDFIDQIKAIFQQIEKIKAQIQNEQATKTAFIMPFIQALGYNVFNPMEVAPEFTADVPGLKGEKVDYAIIKDNKPIILMECKSCHENLENPKHSSQLHRYFNATDAKFGILTNGIIYRFYTDIDKVHIMDDKPFFEFNMLNFSDSDVNELKRFSKSIFDINELSDVAQNLLYTKEIKRIMAEQLSEPSPDFVRFFASKVYSGKMMATVVDKFTEITKRSLKDFVNERITDRLKSAIDLPEALIEIGTSEDSKNNAEGGTDKLSKEEQIVTTQKELEAFYIVKSILRESVDIGRIRYKDTISYFGINLDGNVKKTICRLYLNSNKKFIAIFDAEGKEIKTTISSLDDIYSVSQFLKDKVVYLTQGKSADELLQVEVI